MEIVIRRDSLDPVNLARPKSQFVIMSCSTLSRSNVGTREVEGNMSSNKRVYIPKRANTVVIKPAHNTPKTRAGNAVINQGDTPLGLSRSEFSCREPNGFRMSSIVDTFPV